MILVRDAVEEERLRVNAVVLQYRRCGLPHHNGLIQQRGEEYLLDLERVIEMDEGTYGDQSVHLGMVRLGSFGLAPQRGESNGAAGAA